MPFTYHSHNSYADCAYLTLKYPARIEICTWAELICSIAQVGMHYNLFSTALLM
jgi:hypothetical protein